MTLTTEQLRARAKFWREKAVEVKWESVSIAQDMLQNADAFDELAANREAQPSIIDEAIDRIVVPLSPDGLDEEKHHCEWHLYHDRERIRKGLREYFAAPPAPANANAVAWEMRYWNSGHNMWHDWERITAEQHAEMSVQHATDNDYEFRVLYDAPAAPAVPDSLANDIDSDDHPLLWSYNNGWNACRAAMLAQPVSGGYKLDGGENCWSCGKHFTYVQHSECDGYCPHCGSPVDIDDDEDHQSKVVPAEPTEEMISSAWREATGKCDHETIKRMYKAMLAAAPEGGN